MSFETSSTKYKCILAGYMSHRQVSNYLRSSDDNTPILLLDSDATNDFIGEYDNVTYVFLDQFVYEHNASIDRDSKKLLRQFIDILTTDEICSLNQELIPAHIPRLYIKEAIAFLKTKRFLEEVFENYSISSLTAFACSGIHIPLTQRLCKEYNIPFDNQSHVSLRKNWLVSLHRWDELRKQTKKTIHGYYLSDDKTRLLLSRKIKQILDIQIPDIESLKIVAYVNDLSKARALMKHMRKTATAEIAALEDTAISWLFQNWLESSLIDLHGFFLTYRAAIRAFKSNKIREVIIDGQIGNKEHAAAIAAKSCSARIIIYSYDSVPNPMIGMQADHYAYPSVGRKNEILAENIPSCKATPTRCINHFETSPKSKNEKTNNLLYADSFFPGFGKVYSPKFLFCHYDMLIQIAKSLPDKTIYLKFHPKRESKHNNEYFTGLNDLQITCHKQYIDKNRQSDNILFLDSESSFSEALANCDILLNLESTVAIEAYLFKTPVLFLSDPKHKMPFFQDTEKVKLPMIMKSVDMTILTIQKLYNDISYWQEVVYKQDQYIKNSLNDNVCIFSTKLFNNNV